MELTQLRYFKEAAQCGNITQAAQKLHISQPALSLAIKKLEEECGALLFEHDKNKIRLNEMGKLALTYAEAILAKAQEMKNIFRRLEQKDGVLSFGFCDPGPMRFSIPSLQKSNPDLTITSELFENEDNLENLLLFRKYDAVVSLKKPDNKEITSLPFAEEELMLSVPKGHPLAGRKSILLENEKNLELIHYTCDGAYVRKVQPFIDRMKSRHAMKIYHDYFLFRQLLENQNLVCFTTKLVRRYRNDGEDRIIIPLEDEGISAVYWLSYLRDSQKKVLPILNWQKSMPFLLKESLSKR